MNISSVNFFTGSSFLIIGIVIGISQIVLIKRSVKNLKAKKGSAAIYYFRILSSSIILLAFIIFEMIVLYFLVRSIGGYYPPNQ
jgi:hypothetical protein